jgi:uncharacterized protein (TIGR02391 family)
MAILQKIRAQLSTWLQSQNICLPLGCGWNERDSLLPAPGITPGWVYVSRRGHEAVSREKFNRYKHAALLPRAILHASLAATAFSAFLRGEYDIAIFASFRAVEDAVRTVCGFPNQLVGVDLMRKAFDGKNNGPLVDVSAVPGEQEAVAHVFAGSMGIFKNPHEPSPKCL